MDNKAINIWNNIIDYCDGNPELLEALAKTLIIEADKWRVKMIDDYIDSLSNIPYDRIRLSEGMY